MNGLVRISWLDSCGRPTSIHLTEDGMDTLCGGHSEYLLKGRLARSPRRSRGRTKYCRICFANGGKALPWDSRCEDRK
jgi:hypothetical protein